MGHVLLYLIMYVPFKHVNYIMLNSWVRYWNYYVHTCTCTCVILTVLYILSIGAAGLRNGRFSSGSGPIHLTNVNCGGNESSLFDCYYGNDTLHCNHGMDASVTCGKI